MVQKSHHYIYYNDIYLYMLELWIFVCLFIKGSLCQFNWLLYECIKKELLKKLKDKKNKNKKTIITEKYWIVDH